jgi:hypothetical protein
MILSAAVNPGPNIQKMLIITDKLTGCDILSDSNKLRRKTTIMAEYRSIVEQMDEEIFSFTGGKPKEVNVTQMHAECLEKQRINNGGGENNELELQWLRKIKERQEEIQKRKEKMIEEVEEIEEIGELTDLERDGIILKRQ